MSEAEFESPKPNFEKRSIAAGSSLFREGEEGTCAFLIQSGQVEITKRSQRGHRIRLSVLGRGAIAGEMALIGQRLRMASAVCLSDVEVIVIPKAEFNRRLEEMDDVMRRVLRLLVEKLHAMSLSYVREKDRIR